MKETTLKPKKGLRQLLFRMAVAVAAVYLVASFVNGQFQVAAKQRELEELTGRVAQQVDTNRELQRLMENDDDDAYVERVAREKLGFARPHERIFMDLTGE